MLMVNDYIQLVKKPYDDFPIDTTMIGKVINIQNNTIIVKYPMGNMMMSMDEFTKYFERHILRNSDNKILNKTAKREFTKWTVFNPDFDSYVKNLPVTTPRMYYEYCTNGKTVKVRKCCGSVKKDRDILTGRASCSPSDTFDLQTGIKIAYDRCKKKEISKQLSELNRKLNYYDLDSHTY